MRIAGSVSGLCSSLLPERNFTLYKKLKQP